MNSGPRQVQLFPRTLSWGTQLQSPWKQAQPQALPRLSRLSPLWLAPPQGPVVAIQAQDSQAWPRTSSWPSAGGAHSRFRCPCTLRCSVAGTAGLCRTTTSCPVRRRSPSRGSRGGAGGSSSGTGSRSSSSCYSSPSSSQVGPSGRRVLPLTAEDDDTSSSSCHCHGMALTVLTSPCPRCWRHLVRVSCSWCGRRVVLIPRPLPLRHCHGMSLKVLTSPLPLLMSP